MAALIMVGLLGYLTAAALATVCCQGDIHPPGERRELRGMDSIARLMNHYTGGR